MSITTNSEFAKRMMLLAKPAQQFKPTAVYDSDGDCIEFLAKPDPFYAERVDDLVTVYYSQETGEVIGSLIKGVSHFCKQMFERMPGFRIEITDGRASLQHIFLVADVVHQIRSAGHDHSHISKALRSCGGDNG